MVVHGPSLPTLPTPPKPGVDAPAASRQADSLAPATRSVGEQSLWGVLTEEERTFFAQQAELGPLSYGPKGAKMDHPEPPKGQRLDVRV
jgi:hypothetical protein